MLKNRNNQTASIREIERLLGKQVHEIEQRIDERVEDRLAQQTVIILGAVDEKLEQNRKEFKQEINELRISVDKFVGFYAKQDQEFTIMKEHMKRLEARLEKLEARSA